MNRQPNRMQANCPRCRQLIKWRGPVTDRPRCPRCGHKPDQATLARLAAQVQRIRLGLIEDGILPAGGG